MFVGLVSDPRWQPPEGAPEPERAPVVADSVARDRLVAVFCAMLWLVPVVDHAFGPLAGYGFLLRSRSRSAAGGSTAGSAASTGAA